MKYLASILGISLILLALTGASCGYSIYAVGQDILNNKLQTSNFSFQFFRWCTNRLPFANELPQILDNKSYLVLLQNNTELRPSGGFLGSYAKLETAPTGLKNVIVQDIYVPDGQLVGHVDPPLPIQQAFGQGWWKLRDANWDPDFRVAGEQTAWFFEQGNDPPTGGADGLIAINLSLVNSLIEIFGPLKLVDYPDTITSNNFYELAQKYAEENFFPGSTQKRDFLGAVGRAVILKIQNAKPRQLIAITKLVFEQLKSKQILLWFQDPGLEKIAHDRHWDGDLGSPTNNYLYIVETNLGANKANCCISRSVNQRLSESAHQLEISWKNDNQFASPVKPYFWGGDYVNYVRVIIPAGSKVQRVRVAEKELINKTLDNQFGLQQDRYQIEERDQFKIIGFWAKVPAGKTILATMNYELPTTNSILVKRQPGIESFDYKLIVDGKTIFDKNVTADVNIGPWTR